MERRKFTRELSDRDGIGSFLSPPVGADRKGKSSYSDSSKDRSPLLQCVRHGMDYADPGASYYEERYRQRVLTNLQRRAKAFGYVLQPTEIKVVSTAVS